MCCRRLFVYERKPKFSPRFWCGACLPRFALISVKPTFPGFIVFSGPRRGRSAVVCEKQTNIMWCMMTRSRERVAEQSASPSCASTVPFTRSVGRFFSNHPSFLVRWWLKRVISVLDGMLCGRLRPKGFYVLSLHQRALLGLRFKHPSPLKSRSTRATW